MAGLRPLDNDSRHELHLSLRYVFIFIDTTEQAILMYENKYLFICTLQLYFYFIQVLHLANYKTTN